MRHLVRCSACARQYDVTGRTAGERFMCHCGDRLEVVLARGHEASLVRCSACGGARESGDARCAHCGGDFTLHERDLDTVCPACLARISDRAHFCHHCGQAIHAEPTLSRPGETPCPACRADQRLHHRALRSDLGVLECSRCAGLWVGHDEFHRLVEDAKEEADEGVAALRSVKERPAIAPQTGPLYRRCAVCDQFMQRRNFGRTSGIIIDVCHAHGAWFDSEELAGILRWLRAGGAQRQQRAEQQRAADQRRAERARQAAARSPLMAPVSPAQPSGVTLIAALVQGLLSLLR